MWLFTICGFFSVVQKPGTTNLTVRARVSADLDALRERYMPELSAITSQAGTDYPYRATISHEAFSQGLVLLAQDLHYCSFKEEVEQSQGRDRSQVYSEVWCHLHQLEAENHPNGSRNASGFGKRLTFGGVVVNCDGKVLLREPFNHRGGYVWTFPKDTPANGEKPEETAVRAVLQKTGVRAKVIDQIPGMYTGELTTNMYFLMSYEGEDGKGSGGSKAVLWAGQKEAERRMKMSSSIAGRARDLEVLTHAMGMIHQRFKTLNADELDTAAVERAILNTAALRFDGYKYQDDTHFDPNQALDSYFKQGEWPVSPLDQLCIYFTLQRFLGKWRGGQLAQNSKHWRAFRELFLKTCGYCIPPQYSYAEACARWKSEFLPKLSECTALVKVIHQTTQYDAV